MTRFLKLTNIIINTTKIETIDILPTKYMIHMSNQKIDGWLLFTSGSVESKNTMIEVCKTEHPIDYQAVKEWVRQTI